MKKIITILGTIFLASIIWLWNYNEVVTSCFFTSQNWKKDMYEYYIIPNVSFIQHKDYKYIFWKRNLCGNALIVYSADTSDMVQIPCKKIEKPKFRLRTCEDENARITENRLQIPKDHCADYFDFHIKCE